MWGSPVALCQPPVQLGCGRLMGGRVLPHSYTSKPCLPDPPRLVFLIVVLASWNGQMTSSDSWIVWGNLQWIVGLIVL